MGDMMDQYLDDMQELIAELEGKDDAKRAEAIAEGQEMLEQMTIEIHSIANRDKKKTIQLKIASFREKIQLAKRQQLLAGPGGLQDDQEAALDGNAADGGGSSSELRAQGSLATLERARAQLQETEEVGNEVLTNLEEQRATIQRSRDNNKEIHGQLNKSNKLLNAMSKWWRG